jgi:hypothetical protein
MSIPERYKNMGFTHVGQKMKGDGKHKWKVLAKKGDQYKVVQGGWRGMDDFSQHHSDKRKERFWDRMGGRNSAKAKDPFSPLYWHKRLGTWEEGGQIDADTIQHFAQGGIYIDPSKRGTFKAQATRMGMGVQEAAAHILANKEDYSPAMVKKANFARNFAKEYGGMINNQDIVNEDLMKNYKKGGSTWSGNAWYQFGGNSGEESAPLTPVIEEPRLRRIFEKNQRLDQKRIRKSNRKEFDPGRLVPVQNMYPFNNSYVTPFEMGGSMPCYECGGYLPQAQDGKQVPSGKTYYVTHGYPEDAYRYDGDNHYVKGIAQVERPEGMRFYEGNYKSRDKTAAAQMAKHMALYNAINFPADSMRTNGVYPRIMTIPDFAYGGGLPQFQGNSGASTYDSAAIAESIKRQLEDINFRSTLSNTVRPKLEVVRKDSSKVLQKDSIPVTKVPQDSNVNVPDTALNLLSTGTIDPSLQQAVDNKIAEEKRKKLITQIGYGAAGVGSYAGYKGVKATREAYKNTRAIDAIVKKIFTQNYSHYSIDDIAELVKNGAPDELINKIKEVGKLDSNVPRLSNYVPDEIPAHLTDDVERTIYARGLKDKYSGLADDAMDAYRSAKSGIGFKMSEILREYPWLRKMFLLKKAMGGDIYNPMDYAQYGMTMPYYPTESYMPQEAPMYKEGGYTVGDEIDVTPEQLEQLKAQGYNFEMI